MKKFLLAFSLVTAFTAQAQTFDREAQGLADCAVFYGAVGDYARDPVMQSNAKIFYNAAMARGKQYGLTISSGYREVMDDLQHQNPAEMKQRLFQEGQKCRALAVKNGLKLL